MQPVSNMLEYVSLPQDTINGRMGDDGRRPIDSPDIRTACCGRAGAYQWRIGSASLRVGRQRVAALPAHRAPIEFGWGLTSAHGNKMQD